MSMFSRRTDWKLTPTSLKALQEYFAKPWLKEATKLRN